MAQFDYNATYNGESDASKLVGNVCDAVTKAVSHLSHMEYDIREMSHPNYRKAFRFEPDQQNVLFGVRLGASSHLEICERAVMSFSGRQNDVLQVKDLLLEEIPNLKLE